MSRHTLAAAAQADYEVARDLASAHHCLPGVGACLFGLVET